MMKIRNLALLSLLAVPVAPFVLSDIASAAPIEQTKQTTLIQVITQSDETLYFSPDTIYELPVITDVPVVVNGLNLPAGTVINGRLEPIEGGLRYVAADIEAGGFRTLLSANSDVLHDVKDPRETSAGSIAGDAAIGAAGGAVLGAILGDGIGLGEVLGGAAAGVVVGNVTAQRVVVIEPGEAIVLQAQ
ncbi:MAG: hypothetical protein AAGH78_17060 [Cyanobacteria bacterium P01_H01_bin.58]